MHRPRARIGPIFRAQRDETLLAEIHHAVPELPPLSSDEFIEAMRRLGFRVLREYPNGVTLRHGDCLRSVTIEHVAKMSAQEISVALLVAGISQEELAAALKAIQKISGQRRRVSGVDVEADAVEADAVRRRPA